MFRTLKSIQLVGTIQNQITQLLLNSLESLNIPSICNVVDYIIESVGIIGDKSTQEEEESKEEDTPLDTTEAVRFILQLLPKCLSRINSVADVVLHHKNGGDYVANVVLQLIQMSWGGNINSILCTLRDIELSNEQIHMLFKKVPKLYFFSYLLANIIS